MKHPNDYRELVPIFKTQASCVKYLAAIRWADDSRVQDVRVKSLANNLSQVHMQDVWSQRIGFVEFFLDH